MVQTWIVRGVGIEVKYLFDNNQQLLSILYWGYILTYLPMSALDSSSSVSALWETFGDWGFE